MQIAHARYLGLQPGGSATSILERAWPSRTSSPHWIFWSGRGNGSSNGCSTTGTYKLYVSPTPEALYGVRF